MTNEELEKYIKYLYYTKKLKIKEISKTISCSNATVSRLFKKYNIDTKLHKTRINYKKYGFESLEHLMLTLAGCIQNSMTKKDIAKNFGCNIRTIHRLCKKFSF
jgi:transposase